MHVVWLWTNTTAPFHRTCPGRGTLLLRHARHHHRVLPAPRCFEVALEPSWPVACLALARHSATMAFSCIERVAGTIGGPGGFVLHMIVQTLPCPPTARCSSTGMVPGVDGPGGRGPPIGQRRRHLTLGPQPLTGGAAASEDGTHITHTHTHTHYVQMCAVSCDLWFSASSPH